MHRRNPTKITTAISTPLINSRPESGKKCDSMILTALTITKGNKE